MKTYKRLSVVAPIYNESGNIKPFLKALFESLATLGVPYEIIAVDDASVDNSWEILSTEAQKHQYIKAIRFRTNAGQTAALSAGIEVATGDVIILIDSDLENDPKDIPMLLKKYSEGFGVVSGWRKDRWQGHALTRKIPSRIANWMISRVTGVMLHDYGCTLKIYDAEILRSVRLYGEMHRFIPVYAARQGAKVTELPVSYRPRSFGKTNYGISRTFKVLLDLILVQFLRKYMNKPMHFFGWFGFVSVAIGFCTGSVSVILKLLSIRSFVATPLPIFSALFLIVGIQLIGMGILAEMLIRIYYESGKTTPYVIKEKINLL